MSGVSRVLEEVPVVLPNRVPEPVEEIPRVDVVQVAFPSRPESLSGSNDVRYRPAHPGGDPDPRQAGVFLRRSWLPSVITAVGVSLDDGEVFHDGDR